MARIAATEDAEGIRDEQDLRSEDELKKESTPSEERGLSEKPAESTPTPVLPSRKDMYVATLQEVHDAFDSVNVLRYSQPCHLQGLFILPLNVQCIC